MKHLATWSTVALLLAAAAPALAAPLTVERAEGKLTARGEHFTVTIDAAKGGELAGLALYDGAQWNDVLADPVLTFPAFALSDPEHAYALANDAEAVLSNVKATPDKIACEVHAVPKTADGTPSPWTVVMRYEIYPEGAVFIDLDARLTDTDFVLSDAHVSFAVDEAIRNAPKFRDDNASKETGGFPSARAAFGMNPDPSYTNEIEAIVEYKRPIAGDAAFQREKGRVTWTLGGGGAPLTAPFAYHNRLALGLGAAATGKPRSNVIGQRVYHWVNFLDLEHWYPTNEQIDAMVANNATMLILHMEWMLQRGSNGKPHADYRVARNHDDMVRMMDYAHAKGLRVGLYMRGVEPYALKTGHFAKYCKRDWDGLYVDWDGAAAVSYHESRCKPETDLGDVHFSEDGSYTPARDYFLFTRQLRDLVGPGGFLIGHEGTFNTGVLANLCFDAFLPGETGSDRTMFATRGEAVYRGMQAGGVCMPWMLDLPAYRNAEGCAKMAAWGFYPHIVMGIKARRGEDVVFPLDPNDALYSYILPCWRLLAHIDVEQATVYNLPAQNRTALTLSDKNFAGIVYKAGDTYLVIAANLGTAPTVAEMTLDAALLALTGEYNAQRIDPATGDAQPLGTTTGTLKTSELPQWGLEGFKLTKTAAAP